MTVLENAATQLELVPAAILLTGHFFLIALLFWGLRDKFLLSYWVGLLGAVGGGMVSAYLLQDPKTAPNPVFAVNGILIFWSVCWWLINYFPLGLVAQFVKMLPVRAACRVCTNILRAGTMVARIDAATRVYPGVIAAPLILGTIGATGGKFLVDAILILSGITKGPAELTAPGWPWRSGALASTAYYLLVHVSGVVNPREGKVLVTSVFVAHGLLSDFSGLPLDFTEPIARLLHTMANVPQQPALPGAEKPAAEKPAADETEAKKSK